MGSVEELRAVIDGLVESGPATLADEASLIELQRQLNRLTAVASEAMAAFDAAGSWRESGARSAAAFLGVRCRISKAEAKRRLRYGRACRDLPVVAEAWRVGDLSEEHVRLFLRARNERTAAQLAEHEPMLVDQARRLRFDQFQRVLQYWLHRADPDGVERSADELGDARRLHFSRTFDGAWVTDGLLDPIRGIIVNRELRRIEEELFRADWNAATERLGAGNVTVSDLTRTAAQRRADALVEMARRSATAPADGRRPEPLFTVLVDSPTFAERVCELSDGTVVAPGSLVPWLDEAWIERVVFDGPTRVIDVGVRRRLFEGATRRAVEVRDRECFDEFCDLPAEQCQVDHIQPWAHDGPTVQENGRLACGPHNRRRHRRPDRRRGP